MARVFITGSSTGIGLHTAKQLARKGHLVVLHARSAERAEVAISAVAGAGMVIGDAATLAGMSSIAEQANGLGPFDAVIHNVGVGHEGRDRAVTAEGLARTFAVNVLAPYLLTARITRPARLIYLSSSVHPTGSAKLDDPQWECRRWDGDQAYCDSKMLDTMLALAVARHWSDVLSNAVDPGWVATRMGGEGAPDSYDEGSDTQTWLAVSNDAAAKVSGGYFYRRAQRSPAAAARDEAKQEKLLEYCYVLSGVKLP